MSGSNIRCIWINNHSEFIHGSNINTKTLLVYDPLGNEDSYAQKLELHWKWEYASSTINTDILISSRSYKFSGFWNHHKKEFATPRWMIRSCSHDAQEDGFNCGVLVLKVGSAIKVLNKSFMLFIGRDVNCIIAENSRLLRAAYQILSPNTIPSAISRDMNSPRVSKEMFRSRHLLSNHSEQWVYQGYFIFYFEKWIYLHRHVSFCVSRDDVSFSFINIATSDRLLKVWDTSTKSTFWNYLLEFM